MDAASCSDPQDYVADECHPLLCLQGPPRPRLTEEDPGTLAETTKPSTPRLVSYETNKNGVDYQTPSVWVRVIFKVSRTPEAGGVVALTYHTPVIQASTCKYRVISQCKYFGPH